MLTQEQQIQLEPLTFDPKFGKLLIEAMKTWEEATPFRCTFGITCWDHRTHITFQFETFQFENDNDNQRCCLLGAALYGKKTFNGIGNSLNEIFNITGAEKIAIADGFDSPNGCLSNNLEAFEFAKKVSEIIFGKET